MSSLVHNHGIDPSCKETVRPDGTLYGECMIGETKALDPEPWFCTEFGVRSSRKGCPRDVFVPDPQYIQDRESYDE